MTLFDSISFCVTLVICLIIIKGTQKESFSLWSQLTKKLWIRNHSFNICTTETSHCSIPLPPHVFAILDSTRWNRQQKIHELQHKSMRFEGTLNYLLIFQNKDFCIIRGELILFVLEDENLRFLLPSWTFCSLLFCVNSCCALGAFLVALVLAQ